MDPLTRQTVALDWPWSSARAHTVNDALEVVLDHRWVMHSGKWNCGGLKRACSTDNQPRPSQVNPSVAMADVRGGLCASGAAAALEPASLPTDASHYLGLD
jgi:hypothetical protein